MMQCNGPWRKNQARQMFREAIKTSSWKKYAKLFVQESKPRHTPRRCSGQFSHSYVLIVSTKGHELGKSTG